MAPSSFPEPMTKQVICPRRKPATAILLNKYCIKLILNDLPLYP